MNIISAWVTNIIIFILLATIIEMLLPRSVMQKYVKLVVSIFLLLIIAQPLLSLFTKNIDELMVQMENQFLNEEERTEKLLNLNKKEIEGQQLAYISEQIAVLLENEVKERLKDDYKLLIINLDVQLENKPIATMSEADLRLVSVVVQPIDEADTQLKGQTIVDLVDVDIQKQIMNKNKKNDAKEEELLRFFSEQWQIEMEKIEVNVKGGSD